MPILPPQTTHAEEPVRAYFGLGDVIGVLGAFSGDLESETGKSIRRGTVEHMTGDVRVLPAGTCSMSWSCSDLPPEDR